MLTNADITVFNRVYDPKSRANKWKRTVLHGVHASVNLGSSQVNNDRRVQNDAIFRVPSHCKEYGLYIAPCDYKGNGWTFAPGDIVVSGICQFDIKGDADLIKLGITPFKIDSAKDNRRGLNPHLRARCK